MPVVMGYYGLRSGYISICPEMTPYAFRFQLKSDIEFAEVVKRDEKQNPGDHLLFGKPAHGSKTLPQQRAHVQPAARYRRDIE